MGTRNLTCVVKGGEYIVAKYCQWDGYPEGQGITILNFLRNQFDREKFEKQLELVETITADKMKQFWAEAGADPECDWVGMDEANRFRRRFPHLHRDMGGEILEFIQEFPSMLDFGIRKDAEYSWKTDVPLLEGEENLPSALEAMGGKIMLQNDLEFAKDGLFCEWCYVLDLDNGKFEVYQGFNHGKVGRFGSDLNEDGYAPVGLIKSYNLTNLPDEKQFLDDLADDEEDEFQIPVGEGLND